MNNEGRKNRAILYALLLILTLLLTSCGESTLADPKQSSDCGDRMIGGLVWLSDDEFADPPENDDIKLEYTVEDEERKVKVNRSDILGAYVIENWENGELQSISSYIDPRFIEGPMNVIVDSSAEIETTLYVDAAKDITAFVYHVYETPTGELYAKRESAGFGFGRNGGANWIEEKNEDGESVKVSFKYEPYVAYEKMIVKQFDLEDNCIAIESFSPEQDVSLSKHENMHYAICEYHKGKQIDRKVIENDTVERIVMNQETHIGEKRDIQMQ